MKIANRSAVNGALKIPVYFRKRNRDNGEQGERVRCRAVYCAFRTLYVRGSGE